MNDIVLGIRLKADGSGLVGEVRASTAEMEKLTAATRRASEAGSQHGRISDAMTRGMSSATIASRRLADGMSEAGRTATAQTAAQDKLAGSGLNLTRTLAAAAIAYGAFRSALSLVEQYRAQEQAVAKLDVTIASLGRSTAGLSGRIQMLAAQLQRDGVIGDEAIIEGASFLAMYGKITDELLPRTIRVMADLAAKTGGDVTTAARAMGMAAEGSTDLLRRQGITISETAKKSGDFAQVLAEVERAVGGTNIALGDTATGGMQQAANALGEVLEESGRLIANLAGASGLTEAIKNNAAAWQGLLGAINDAIESGEGWSRVVGKLAVQWTSLPRGVQGLLPGGNLIADVVTYGTNVAAANAGEMQIRAETRDAEERARRSAQFGGIDLSVLSGQFGVPDLDVELTASEQYTQSLEKQLRLIQDNSAAAAVRWEIENGALMDATEAERQRNIAIAEQIDAQNAASEAAKVRAKGEADLIEFVMEASDQAAERQRKELDERERSQTEWVETLRQSLLTETELEDERYRKSLEKLKQAEAEKIESITSYADLRQRLEREHEQALADIRDKANAEQLRREEEEAKARAELMMEPFKNAIRGIQSSFTDFFENVFHGGINSFKELARAIKDIFLRLAAEIASLLVFRPVLAGILSSVGGTALAAQLGLTGSLTGTGGFSLPGIPGIGNLFSGAGSLINNIGGMLGFGVPQAAVGATGIAGMAGTEGITQFFASAAGGNVAGVAPGALSGASLTGILGAGALGYLGGGMFADLLGLNSQNGSIGGGLGAGIGFAVGGPIGGLIGGLGGSVLGGLFGNDKDYPFTNAQILVDKQGVASIGRIQGLDGGDQAAVRALAEAAVAQFNALVQAQGITFDRPFQFFLGSNVDRGSKDQLGTGFYAGSYGGFAGGATVTGLQSPEQAVQAAVQYAISKGTPGESAADKAAAEAAAAALAQQQNQFTKGLKDMLEVMRSGFPALTQLRQQFRAMKEQAKELGDGLDLVKKAYREQLKDLRDSLKDQIRGLLDQAYQALNISGLSSFRDSLSFSALAPGSPIDRFNAAQDLLNQTAASALAGDNAAAQLFPQLAQELLTLGRDVYASGPQYAELFTTVNTQLNDVIANQQTIYEDLVASVAVTIEQTSQDQIAVLREELGRVNETLLDVKAELRRTRAA